MASKKRLHRQKARAAAVAALALALMLACAAVLVSGCSSESASTANSTAASSVETSSAAASSAEAGNAEASSSTVTMTSSDMSSWQTVGDALANKTTSLSSTWDDKHYVSVFESDGAYIRIVADVDEAHNEAAENVDWEKGDVGEQVEQIFSDLPLASAEDLTSGLVSQDELDTLVGKTGAELIEAGYTFQNYYMYDSDETGASFAKGDFTYDFTFEVSVDEAHSEDGGASVQDVPCKSAEFLGISDDAVSLESL